MLKDKLNNRTYSTRIDAIRQLGEKEFKRLVKNNYIEYILCTHV